MSRRPRGLRPDEAELWRRIAASARPMHPELSARPLHDPPLHERHERPAPKKAPPAGTGEFRLGQSLPDRAFGHDLAPSLAERLAHAPVRMDRRTHQQMLRGKLKPEARIDLHGMTVVEAHPGLIRFLLRAHAEGRRLVLVITGKGGRGPDEGPIPQRHGVLRQQVPLWLAQPPLGAVVQQVAEAHLRHGGSGAYYVYLRRHG